MAKKKQHMINPNDEIAQHPNKELIEVMKRDERFADEWETLEIKEMELLSLKIDFLREVVSALLGATP
ncbi:unnamed protein product [Arabis nemorensis]|uniref:Glabrous enhancer-binding protein-like C-terminal domain-containing protein n=1 Tax=Arabis nemorensis TaxID=586526 RepID=A0A565BKG9_9BRAS|nr:unnamed protein product [Arabis nemorensis]